MSPDSPEEPDFHGQALSPVSPKPLHFPKPSNIPLLEDQMDPAYNGASDFAKPPQSLAVTHEGVKVNGDGEAAKGASEDETAQNEDDEPFQNGSHADAGLQNGHDTTQSDVVPASAQPADPSFPSLTMFDQNDHSAERGDVTLGPGGAAPASFAAGSASEYDTAGPSDTYHSGKPRGSTDPAVDAYEPPTNLSHGSHDPTSGVNIQALLDNLSSSIVTAPASDGLSSLPSQQQSSEPVSAVIDPSQTASSEQSTPLTATLPPGTSLPPRPPPQENPTSQFSESDLRLYHLHGHQQQQPTTQKYASSPGTSLRPPGSLPPPIAIAGAPGTTLSANNLPPPPVPTFQQANPNAANQHQNNNSAITAPSQDSGDRPVDNGDYGEDSSQRWSQDVQKKYDAFLQDERMYVTKGEWHTFPANSRLFIGNLPTEKVTKRDLFHVFHKYGKLAQVSIKQAYGFIQYLEAADCLRALQTEQGTSVRGRKIHLEISKPQRGNQNSGKANRRSRSPDYTRGGNNNNSNNNNNNNNASGNQKGGDRYRGGENRRRDSPRVRDDYRPGRSPSPRSRGSRRSPNRRRRSRSRSPQARYRSSSPRRGTDDDIPLPRRAPHEVPDVQIIAKDDPDRAFVSYVEKAFEARGIKCNVLLLSPRLSESSVVRRQIIEGVLGVVKLDRAVQMTQKFQLSIFDRSGGANNVKFEEYADITLNICVELVLRAKQTAAHLQQTPQYYGLPMAHGVQHQQPSVFPHLPQMPQQPQGSSQFPLDTASLQQLLGRAQQQQPHPPQPNYGGQQQFPQGSDLSRLLASASGSSLNSPPPYQNFNLGGIDGLLGRQGSTPAQQHMQQPPPQQSPTQQKPDMANLMAMLGRYK